MRLWIVHGSTGEYDDYMTWTVIAYKSKEMAEHHAEIAQKEAAKYRYDKMNYDERDNIKNPYDERMRLDYTGTSYYVTEVDLSDIRNKQEFEEHYFLESI